MINFETLRRRAAPRRATATPRGLLQGLGLDLGNRWPERRTVELQANGISYFGSAAVNGLIGSSSATDGTWTNLMLRSCDLANIRLYCVEQ